MNRAKARGLPDAGDGERLPPRVRGPGLRPLCPSCVRGGGKQGPGAPLKASLPALPAGVNVMLRKIAVAAASKPAVEIKQEGDTFYIKTSTTVRTTEINFKIGEEFEEQTVDGRPCKVGPRGSRRPRPGRFPVLSWILGSAPRGEGPSPALLWAPLTWPLSCRAW